MKVLFVCTGNTCRSPMAEGILNDMARQKKLDIEGQSAGIFAMAGSGAADNAIKAMKNIGVDIANHRASLISGEGLEDVDLILTMSRSHRENLISYFPHMKEKIFMLNEYAFNTNKDVEDPFGLGIEYYEEARDEIYRAIEEIVNREED